MLAQVAQKALDLDILNTDGFYGLVSTLDQQDKDQGMLANIIGNYVWTVNPTRRKDCRDQLAEVAQGGKPW